MKGEGEINLSYQIKKRLTMNSGFTKTKGISKSFIDPKNSKNNIKISKSENKINTKHILRKDSKQVNEKGNIYENNEFIEDENKFDDYDLKAIKESQSQFIYKIFDEYNIFQKNNELMMPHNTQYMRMCF